MASNGSSIYVLDMDSVFRSDDDGNSWINVTGDLIINYDGNLLADQQVIYLDLKMGDGDLFRTLNSGLDWTEVTTSGLPESSYGYISCFIQDGDTTWAGTSDGVYIYFPGAFGWQSRSNGLPEGMAVSEMIIFQGEKYCGGYDGIYRLSGGTWMPYNEGLEGTYIFGLTSTGNALYCLDRDGPWQKDPWSSWYPIFDNLNLIDVNSISFQDSVVWACTDGGLYKSTDLGLNFEKVPPDTLRYVYKMIVTDSVLYLATYKGFYLSRDGGDTWITANSGFVRLNVTVISVGPVYSYASSSGLYRCLTGVYEWEKVPNSMGSANIWDVESKDSIVILEVYNDWARVSLDYGENFDTLFYGCNDFYTSQDNFYAIRDVPYYSYDGLNWTMIPMDEPEYKGVSIAVQDDVIVTSGVLFSYWPYDRFVAVSYNFGQEWTNIVDNLPPMSWPYISHVNINENRIFACPMGMSLWYRDDLLTTIENPGDLSDINVRIYPNPFAENVMLEFEDEVKEKITVTVLDLLGNTVFSATEQNTRKVILDLGDQSSGIYFIRVNDGRGSRIYKAIKI